MAKIFPILCFAREAFQGYSSWPRSRERAFLRAVRELCLLTGDLPNLPEPFKELTRVARSIPPEHLTTETEILKTLENWEDILAGTFSSEVLIQGQAVKKAIEPALISSRIFYVIDPYLLSYKPERPLSPYSDGLRYLLSYKPKILQGIATLGFEDFTDPQKHERIKGIVQLLADQPETTAITIFLYPNGSPIHDRFIGFCNRTEDSHWHALSLGYGLSALSECSQKPTCLARISTQHFKEVWQLALDQCCWCITRDPNCSDLGGGWVGAASLSNPKKHVRVYALESRTIRGLLR